MTVHGKGRLHLCFQPGTAAGGAKKGSGTPDGNRREKRAAMRYFRRGHQGNPATDFGGMNRGKTGTAAKNTTTLFLWTVPYRYRRDGLPVLWAKRRRKNYVFKALLGLIRPDGGSIQLLGKPLEQFVRRTGSNWGLRGPIPASAAISQWKTSFRFWSSFYSRFDKPFFLEQLQKWELPSTSGSRNFPPA